jgi:predicted enzyme related to lactoylglutathione lyase
MSSQLDALCVAAHDPGRLATFWGELLEPDDTGFTLRFRPTDEPKTRQNQSHLDLRSAEPGDQELTVAKALRLGARPIDIGQRPEEGHVVLADPEGNEFCVLEDGNSFVADCGFVGSVACDGSQTVGYFWHEALGWPLVWDQDQETAIQSPHGGPKLTWGGPPYAAKTEQRNRLHFDLLSPGDLRAEVARLVSLGAHRLADHGQRVELTDPDGNEFCLLEGPAS